MSAIEIQTFVDRITIRNRTISFLLIYKITQYIQHIYNKYTIGTEYNVIVLCGIKNILYRFI